MNSLAFHLLLIAVVVTLLFFATYSAQPTSSIPLSEIQAHEIGTGVPVALEAESDGLIHQLNF